MCAAARVSSIFAVSHPIYDNQLNDFVSNLHIIYILYYSVSDLHTICSTSNP
jgi:hypothetical protein